MPRDYAAQVGGVGEARSAGTSLTNGQIHAATLYPRS
jgi:hypothetical protein